MKEKKQRIYRTIMLILVVALVTFITTTVLMYNGSIKYVISSKDMPNNATAKKLDFLLATITELLNEKYIGEVNEEDLIDGALKGLVAGTGDVYTTYFTKAELEEFKAETLGSFVGIGVYLQGNLETGKVEVIKPIKGSPAEEAGLKPGDEVIKADGKEYKAEQLDELSKYIKGEEGTEITLTVKREEEQLDIKVIRKNVHMNYVDSQMLEDDIGYISITTFDEDCAKDFKTEYDNLVGQNAKSLIIDLRNNGGGLVDEALEIADLMCDKNEITLLVAALKENEKAEIVGDKTFGKGVIQELIYLSNGGALKVTSSEYYTPKKNKINKVGIEPNYEISLDIKNLDVDEQLNKAIEVIKEKNK